MNCVHIALVLSKDEHRRGSFLRACTKPNHSSTV